MGGKNKQDHGGFSQEVEGPPHPPDYQLNRRFGERPKGFVQSVKEFVPSALVYTGFMIGPIAIIGAGVEAKHLISSNHHSGRYGRHHKDERLIHVGTGALITRAGVYTLKQKGINTHRLP